jgi:hypothetical protein
MTKLCFEPKKVDEKPSNGNNPLTEPKCEYLSILERSFHIEFEKKSSKKLTIEYHHALFWKYGTLAG